MRAALIAALGLLTAAVLAQTPGSSDLWWRYPSSLGDATNYIAFNLRCTPVVAKTNLPPWTNWIIAATTRWTNANVAYGGDYYVGVFVTNSLTGKEAPMKETLPVERWIW